VLLFFFLYASFSIKSYKKDFKKFFLIKKSRKLIQNDFFLQKGIKNPKN